MRDTQPALVLQRAAVLVPRPVLLLFCSCWIVPGLLGRDPWRNADVQAYGIMVAMAEGRTSWWAPTLGMVPMDVALLPHWLGAVFIMGGGDWMDSAVAARLPFALLLAGTLLGVWWTTFQLAQTGPAQPLPLAFGGEAQPQAYARALADGALLALIATLGLLQLGHETTPELAQLASATLFLGALARMTAGPCRTAVAMMLLALPLLAGSGAPALAVGLGAAGGAALMLGRRQELRRLAAWPLTAGMLATALSLQLDLWRWRLDLAFTLEEARLIARQWLWFMWPVWPLTLWTLWRWRRHLLAPHVAVPLAAAVPAVATSLLTGGNDRALMLALPGLAVLAAFALPTLARSASAAIDWFSMCFFSAAALFVWFMYVAMQTGVPAKPAANVVKLAVGFEPRFDAWALVPAVAATLAWLTLVRWRTGRHRHALWKSLVLPAGGVALCWVLLMTLWLPLLDYARSARPLVQRVALLVGESPCIAGANFSSAVSASFEVFWQRPVDARAQAATATTCPVLVQMTRGPATVAPEGWVLLGSVSRPTDRSDVANVYRRTTLDGSSQTSGTP